MTKSALIAEINRRILPTHFEPLDSEAKELLRKGTDRNEIDGLFDYLRDHCGIDCDDIRPDGALLYQLERIGFRAIDQGGGMVNMRIILESGMEMFCAAYDGSMPDDRHPVQFGVCINGDVISETEYKTGMELANKLSFAP